MEWREILQQSNANVDGMRARNIQNTFSAADSRSKKAEIRLDSFSIDVRAVPASCGRESVEVEAGGEANSSAGEQGRHSSSPFATKHRSTEFRKW